MSTAVQELYSAKTLAANATAIILPANTVCAFGGFLCTAAGNFNLKDASGTDIIPIFGVTAGQYVIGGFTTGNGLQVVLSGGAAGVVSYGTAG